LVNLGLVNLGLVNLGLVNLGLVNLGLVNLGWGTLGLVNLGWGTLGLGNKFAHRQTGLVDDLLRTGAPDSDRSPLHQRAQIRHARHQTRLVRD